MYVIKLNYSCAYLENSLITEQNTQMLMEILHKFIKIQTIYFVY